MALNVLREKGTASLQALLLFCAAPGVEKERNLMILIH